MVSRSAPIFRKRKGQVDSLADLVRHVKLHLSSKSTPAKISLEVFPLRYNPGVDGRSFKLVYSFGRKFFHEWPTYDSEAQGYELALGSMYESLRTHFPEDSHLFEEVRKNTSEGHARISRKR